MRICWILALENQEIVDYSMPFRCMQYDVMENEKQLEELRRKNEREKLLVTCQEKLCGLRKEDRMTPVYTLCLYHGEDRWDGPRSLGDMMNFAEKKDGIRTFFNDYPLRLYCLNETENLDLFRTEVAKLFRAMQYRGDRAGLTRLLESDLQYQHIDRDTLEAMTVLLKMPAIWEKRSNVMVKKSGKEEYDMCRAVREWSEEERKIGWEECQTVIVKNLLNRGDSDEDIMQVAACDRDFVAKVRAMRG